MTDCHIDAATHNPDGIPYADAVRSLRKNGYSDADISHLIEIVGQDDWGARMWRWRTTDSRRTRGDQPE
jgi:hypothetical protein